MNVFSSMSTSASALSATTRRARARRPRTFAGYQRPDSANGWFRFAEPQRGTMSDTNGGGADHA